MDERGYGGGDPKLGTRIFMVDLSSGQATVIATAHDHDAAWMPAIDGDDVVWVEWHYEDNATLRGACTWRVMHLDLGGGEPEIVAEGVSRRLEAGTAVPPAVSVHQGSVAYTVEDASPTRPNGWRIVVKPLHGDASTIEVPTELDVYAIALGGGSVAYSEGQVDQDLGFKYQTRLMLAEFGGHPTKLADDAFELAFADDRLAWTSDAAASQAQSGLAQSPRILTKTPSDPAPVPLSAEPGPAERSGQWPSTGGGLVSWTDNQDTPLHPDPNGDHLVVWSPQSGARQLEPTSGTGLSSVGGGWIVWLNDWNDRTFVEGVRLQDVPGLGP